jgi:hypothetical protein
MNTKEFQKDQFKRDMINFMLGVFMGCIAGVVTIVLITILNPKKSYSYFLGVADTQADAYENGLMEKYINENDRVMYRWVETHDIGYELEMDDLNDEME